MTSILESLSDEESLVTSIWQERKGYVPSSSLLIAMGMYYAILFFCFCFSCYYNFLVVLNSILVDYDVLDALYCTWLGLFCEGKLLKLHFYSVSVICLVVANIEDLKWEFKFKLPKDLLVLLFMYYVGNQMMIYSLPKEIHL